MTKLIFAVTFSIACLCAQDPVGGGRDPVRQQQPWTCANGTCTPPSGSNVAIGNTVLAQCSGSNDTALITTKWQALRAAGGGTLRLSGTCVCPTQLDLSGSPNAGVTIEGVGASNQLGGSGSVMRYTGTAAPFLSFSGAGHALRNIQIEYNNAGFAGTLVAAPVAGFDVSNVTFMGNGQSGALYLLSLNGATDVKISRSTFQNAQYGILGQAVDGSGFSNVVSVNATFNALTVAAIRNPGQAWAIKGTDFEALQNGLGAAIVTDATVTTQGLDISASWTGDVTANSAYTWFVLKGKGINIHGNQIGGSNPRTNAIGIQLVGASSGVHISGNVIAPFTKSIDIGSGLASNTTLGVNDFTSSDMPVSGSFADTSTVQIAGRTGFGVQPAYLAAIVDTAAIPSDTPGTNCLIGFHDFVNNNQYGCIRMTSGVGIVIDTFTGGAWQQALLIANNGSLTGRTLSLSTTAGITMANGSALTDSSGPGIFGLYTSGAFISGVLLDASTDGTIKALVRAGNAVATVIAKPPTSCSGLTTGTLWNNAGIPAICP